MVHPDAGGQGLGKAMGVHCLREAREAGFTAMQFNVVVGTNFGAIVFWKKLGFTIVGLLPNAFRHQALGYIDAYVMHRILTDIKV